MNVAFSVIPKPKVDIPNPTILIHLEQQFQTAYTGMNSSHHHEQIGRTTVHTVIASTIDCLCVLLLLQP